MGTVNYPRIDTIDLKLQIEKKLGRQKSEKYFNLLNKYLSLRIKKPEFDKLCTALFGREHISLHNGLIRAIIKNATTYSKPPTPKNGKIQSSSLNVKLPNGSHRSSSLHLLCRDVFPKKGRTPTLRDRRSRDRPSPLGPHVKVVQKQQSPEEVEQTSTNHGIQYSLGPIKAPIGVCLNTKGTRKVLYRDLDSCYNKGELPDSSSLRTRLERKFVSEGINVSKDCVDLLNNGLDVYVKRLLKPCLDLAALRRSVVNVKKPDSSFFASMTDFRVVMDSNPRMLGEDWPVHLEKVSFRALEEYMDE